MEGEEGQRLKRSRYMVSTITTWVPNVVPPRLCCKHPTETRTSAPGGNASVRDQSYVRREELSRSFSLAIDLRADVAICAREVAAGTQQTIPNVARVYTTVEIWSQELRIGAVEATFVIIVESGGCVRLSLGKTNGGGCHTLADAKAKKRVDTT